MLLVHGICYINWTIQDAPDNVFELMVNCDASGSVLSVKREDVAENIQDLEKHVQRKGYMYIAISVVITSVWFFIFPALDYSTTYDPNSFR